MNGVLLVAAGGLAREVLALERAVGRFQVIRLIDDDTALWGSKLDGAPVVGGLEEVEPYGDSQIVVCAGHGSARRRIVARLSDLGVGPDRYAVVHPSVDVPDGCTVGRQHPAGAGGAHRGRGGRPARGGDAARP